MVPTVHYYQGITIDARLAFQQPDLGWFTATVEATSLGTAQELIYRTNWFKILAYGLLSALCVTGSVLALSQVLGFNAWRYFATAPGGERSAATTYGALLLLFMLAWATVSFGLSFGKAYRYIYAVEQFKRFHASAQWMAYDRAIWEYVKPKYFVELRRQCVRHGFGMLEVLPGQRLRAVIEPSQFDQFAGKRSRLPLWVAAIQTPPKLKGMFQRVAVPQLPFGRRPSSLPPAPAAAPNSPTDGLTDPLDVGQYLPAKKVGADYLATSIRPGYGRPKWYQRPDRRVAHLKWKLRNAWRSLSPSEIRRHPGYFGLSTWYYPSLIMALMVTVGFTYGQSRWSPTARVGGPFETPDVAGIEPAANPEQSLADPNLLPGEYDHQFSADDPKPTVEYLDAKRDYVVESQVENVARYRINQAGESRVDYECLGLYQLPSTYYLLTTGVYPTYEIARRAAENLNAVYQLAVTVAAEECLTLGGGKYYVYLDAPIVEESQANFMVREYLRRYELEIDVLVAE